MPTPNQTRGLQRYREARHKHADIEREFLRYLTELAAARQRLADAQARDDAAAAYAERSRIKGYEQEQQALAQELDRAKKDISEAQTQALGPVTETSGHGFDLLSARHPLLLLPVRLETRFAWTDANGKRSFSKAGLTRVLLVRVFPDEIHEDSHEPELTPAEIGWLAEFDKAVHAASDTVHLKKAWGELIARVGPTRAGWLAAIVADQTKPGVHPSRLPLRPSRLSRPLRARLLPDRWVAFAELDDHSTVVARAPFLVREPLETGPSPEGIDWMLDFDKALAAGMALTIDIPSEVTEVSRLIVVGARGTLSPSETQLEIEQLFDAHHYTRGLELLAPGTPTNSIPGGRAGYTSKPEFEDVFAIEHRRLLVGGKSNPLCGPHDPSAGSRLAKALGIDPETFAYVRGADGTGHMDGEHLRRVLCTTLERRLTRLLDGIFTGNTVADALGFAVDWVDPLGPFAALRVGAQPYGLLPVQLRSQTRPVPGFFDDLQSLLDRLRSKIWDPAVLTLDWVGKPGAADPGRTLVNILWQDAVARETSFRPLFGPQLANQLAGQLGAQEAADLAARRATLAELINKLGAADSRSSAIIDVLQLPFSIPLTAALVEPADVEPTSVQCARNYLEMVASMRLDDLARNEYGAERPRSLLFSIARLAMLESADTEARKLLADKTPPLDSSRWDDESVPTVFGDAYGTALRRLDMSVTLPDPFSTIGNKSQISVHLSERGLERARLAPLRGFLRELKERPPWLLEELLRASFGIFSHRLDAWYTALASMELAARRDDQAFGLNVGAYGVVEHIREAPRRLLAGLYTNPSNGGFIHAPSANHGAAAAVLRSIHLAHAAAGHGEAFSIDLSSERVRRGIELIEGIRAGQPLGALIGYRIERALLAEKVPQFIATFRRAAPIVAHKLTPPKIQDEPAETVAASNVVDGLILLELAGYNGSTLPTVDMLWKNAKLDPLPLSTETAALQRVFDQAQDMLDAVADLVLSESVFQAVQGNSLRAGAAVDSVAGAPVPPAELDSVRTPRTGVGVTHRLLLVLGEPKDRSEDGGWASTPRALAEPRLEAWAQATLPDPAHIGIKVIFREAKGKEFETIETTLAMLHSRTGEYGQPLHLAAIDLVVLADPNDTPHRTSLEIRLAALAAAAYPNKVKDGPIELVFARDKDWGEELFGIVEVHEIVRSLRDVIGHARALAPADLAHPNAAPDFYVESDELARRLAAAEGGLEGVSKQLATALENKTAETLRQALFAADAFGIAGAAPDSLRDAADLKEQIRILERLLIQANAAAAEIAARQKKLADLPIDDAAGRFQAIFGEGFKVLPLLKRGAASDPFAQGPQGATQVAARTWLAQAARVRNGVQLLDVALAYAAAVSEVDNAAPAAELHVTQLPSVSTERWVALPCKPGETIPGGRVSIVAAKTDATLKQETFAGLFIDEWVEVVPSAHETTSVAFHCEAPTATAPQTMLIAVLPAGLESWTPVVAHEVVSEALALAQLRLVDSDVLPQLGQLLPAFFTVENAAGDAVGLDVDSLTNGGA